MQTSGAVGMTDLMRRARRLGRRGGARLGEALRAVLLLPMYLVGGWFRRDPSWLVFGGNGDRFTDNAKHLFLHVAKDPRFTSTWISGDRAVVDQVRRLGHRAEWRWSWRGVRAALRAGWFVYGAYPSDVNFWASRGARLLNLWHGIPLKAIEFDVTVGPLARVYRAGRWSPLRLAFLDRFRRPDVLLSPSPFVTQRCFASAFRLPQERCLELGYPRTDRFFEPTDRGALAEQLGIRSRLPATSRLVGYFPTWRDDGRDFLREAGFSFDRVNEQLSRRGDTMLFKAHPNFADLVPRERTWSNVVVLDPSADLNDVLPLCDVLVTDYSSVAFDFLLLDRPILYFIPDHDRYVGRRNLYFDIEEMMAGPIIRETEQLYAVLGTDLVDGSGTDRDRLRRLLWADYQGGANEKLADFLAVSSAS